MLVLGITRWMGQPRPGTTLGGRLCYYPTVEVRKPRPREAKPPGRGHTAGRQQLLCAVGACLEPWWPGHSPQVQLVPRGVVAVREGPHLALLVRQVLAELVEVVLQRGAGVLGGLQLAVQPQHAGLLLQQLLPLALGEAGTQRFPLPTCPGMPVQAAAPPPARGPPGASPAAP